MTLDRIDDLPNWQLGHLIIAMSSAAGVLVLIGGILKLLLLDLFRVEDVLLHAILVAIFAAFIGLMVFLTAAMDSPSLGEFSVSSDAYRDVLDEVMTAPQPGEARPFA